MSDEDALTGHGIYLAGNFEIEEKLTAEQPQRDSQYRTYILSITCSGADRVRSFSYKIRATGYSAKNMKLSPKNVYYLRGAFFPRNRLDTKDDQFFFEASDWAIITNGGDFAHSLVDTVGITGLGRVRKIDPIVEASIQHLIPKNPTKDKITTVVTVEHSDYHAESKLPRVCQVEYRIRPFPNLAGTHKIVRLGRECLFHRYIKDFNEKTNCYIVIVNRVSPTSGSVDESEISASIGTKPSASGSKSGNPLKPVKFNPRAVNSAFKSPIITSDSQASMPFRPSDFGETSFSSASSKSMASLSKNQSADEESEEEAPVAAKKPKSRAAPKGTPSSTAAPSKHPRAPRACRGPAAGEVLDIASDE
ncbi:uncharacterized protein MELLADRAFT_91561 [Melampsora larici-populina 98AG31]|uniref:Uncharacterized protein n=1 Tax=Melampsora larici-populina (strain 98AG31 / pathotype 3-4-7) TaxID=747676 RepID=F4RZH8_MELLP|nr:uncharacterized protein MELLADRAFT_91561 [Melampsora larici-populina 98AG31]EGG02229.1 hypothetical protein MELLADRAFT_91561 [Melampsora larici-populina 98AG31]